MIARGSAEVTAATKEVSARTGRRAVAITADVTDRADVERMIAETARQLGGLDILVNNAGICIHRPALEVPQEEWRAVMDVNVNGVWMRAGGGPADGRDGAARS